MAKMVILGQTGWQVRGLAKIEYWDGSQGKRYMRETRIPLGELTKERLLACVNDDGYGCKRILEADLRVFEEYEALGSIGRILVRRDKIHLDEARCVKGEKGVWRIEGERGLGEMATKKKRQERNERNADSTSIGPRTRLAVLVNELEWRRRSKGGKTQCVLKKE